MRKFIFSIYFQKQRGEISNYTLRNNLLIKLPIQAKQFFLLDGDTVPRADGVISAQIYVFDDTVMGITLKTRNARKKLIAPTHAIT